MIARKHRFHGHNSVSRVRGSSVRGNVFTVFFAHNKKRQDYRMAVVVSKKVSKSAVVRNRIRRRLYEAVRTAKTLEGQPLDVVFVVHREELATMDAQELFLQVQKACQQMAEKSH